MMNPYKRDLEAEKLHLADMDMLRKNRQIVSFLKKYGKDEVFLDSHCSLFKDYLNDLKRCTGCQGLSFCRQSIHGKFRELYIDEQGFLNSRYISCKFQKKKEQELQHINSFLINHMEEKEMLLDLQPDLALASTNEIYAKSYLLVSNSMNSEKGKGVFLFGQPGTGKSYMMAGLANQYAKKGKKVSFVRLPLLVAELKENLKDDSFRSDIMSDLRNSEILILDDIGAELITPWIRDEILFPTLDYRMNHRKKTYFTSNFNPENLEEHFILYTNNNEKVAAMRLMERIRQLAEFSPLTGESRRT